MKFGISVLLLSFFASTAVSAATFCVNPERVGTNAKQGGLGANFFLSYQDNCKSVLDSRLFGTKSFRYQLESKSEESSTCTYKLVSASQSQGTLTCKVGLTKELLKKEIEESGLLKRSPKLRVMHADLKRMIKQGDAISNDMMITLEPQTETSPEAQR